MKKRLLSIICILALCLTLLPATALAAPGGQYLALGDSITTGYAPPASDGTAQKVLHPFAGQVAEALGYELKNLAADGETSQTLRSKLEDGTIQVPEADLITLTVGGNDLMNGLYAFLVQRYQAANPGEDFDTADAREKLMTGDMEFLSFAAEQVPDFPGSSQATAAMDGFAANLAAIVSAIRQSNPDVRILVASQYNPYSYLAKKYGELFDQAELIASVFDQGAQALNGVIRAGAAEGGYTVLDVYTVFEAAVGQEPAVKPCNPSPIPLNLDFHPNQTGHDLIAQAAVDLLLADMGEVWVNGVQVTRENAMDVLEDGTVYYDALTNTLTLNNARITKPYRQEEGSWGIYTRGALTLRLMGENTVVAEGESFTCGVYAGGGLTVTGEGSLEVQGSDCGISAGVHLTVAGGNVTGQSTDGYGLYAGQDMTVTGGSVTGKSVSSNGIMVEYDLTVTGGSVDGQSISGRGINVSYDVTVTDGTVTGESTDLQGIYVWYDLTAAGGTIIAESVNRYGIYAFDNLYAEGGTIITEGGLAGMQGERLWVNGEEKDFPSCTNVTIAPDGTITRSGAYQIWVGSVQVTQDNAGDVRNDATVSYDGQTNTLTLSGANITDSYLDEDNCFGIYSRYGLNLKLEGENTVALSAANGETYAAGVYTSGGDLNIDGGGSLTVSTAGASNMDGIYAEADLLIDGCTVTAQGGGAEDGGYGGICADSIVITDSTVTAKGTGEHGYGLYTFHGNLTVDAASVLTAESEAPGYTVVTKEGSILADGVAYAPEAEATVFQVEKGTVVSDGGIETVKVLYVGGVDLLGGGTAPDGVRYDAETNTLTLDDASITAPYRQEEGNWGIYAEGRLTIRLEGETTVAAEGQPFTGGVYVDGALIITGPGSLEAQGTRYGIHTSLDLTVQSGSVTGSAVIGGTAEACDGIHTARAMTVTGGTVTGISEGRRGVSVEDVLTVTGGSLTGRGLGEGGLGLEIETLQVTGGSLTAEGTQAAVVVSPTHNGTREELIRLPSGYVPAGYGVKSIELFEYYPFWVIAPEGSTPAYENEVFTGVATQVTLKAPQTGGIGGGGGSGSGTAAPAEPAELPFADVAEGDWFRDAVAYVWEKDIMKGTGETRFSPNLPLTRGQICQVLYNLEAADPVTQSTFTDVAEDAWYAGAVNWAAEKALVQGYGDGRFGPEDSVTREQMAQILYHYAQSKGYDLSPKGDLDQFSDAQAVSGWAREAVTWAVGSGLLSGRTSGVLDPAGTATRAEVAQILQNFCEKVAN